MSIKIKTFECAILKELEIKLNDFIQDLDDCEIVDIKFHVDPQIPIKTHIIPMYVALLMYR